MAERLEGDDLAASIRDRLSDHVDQLAARGHRPTLATVHMGTDPGVATYVEMKQRDCDRLGIDGRHVDIDVTIHDNKIHVEGDEAGLRKVEADLRRVGQGTDVHVEYEREGGINLEIDDGEAESEEN